MQSSRDIGRLIAIVAALRKPGTGCSWDIAQTHVTLAPYALEEAYEVVDAIERGDLRDLRDELGDLLLQVVFHAQVAEEAGAFAFGDLVQAITAKLLRRHPHVFSNAKAGRTDTIGWDEIKAEERRLKTGGSKEQSLLADVPVALPALTRAVKLQKRASSVGFDWGDVRLVLSKIREEIDEIEHEVIAGNMDAVAGEIGDLLFAAANLARHTGVDPEAATRRTNAKFERRFTHIETELARRGSSPAAATLADMDALWDEAKLKGL